MDKHAGLYKGIRASNGFCFYVTATNFWSASLQRTDPVQWRELTVNRSVLYAAVGVSLCKLRYRYTSQNIIPRKRSHFISLYSICLNSDFSSLISVFLCKFPSSLANFTLLVQISLFLCKSPSSFANFPLLLQISLFFCKFPSSFVNFPILLQISTKFTFKNKVNAQNVLIRVVRIFQYFLILRLLLANL